MASIVEQIAAIDAVTLPAGTNDEQRAKLIASTRKLLHRLETPTEQYASVSFMPFVVGAQKTLIQMGVFEKWHAMGDGAQHVDDLAIKAGVDATLLTRLLRLVAAENIVDQVAPLTYKMNEVTKGLLTENFSGLVHFTEDVFVPAAAHMPKYLASLGYQNPSDPDNACFMDLVGVKNMSMFPWLMERPELAKSYSQIVALMAEQAWWPEVYPVEKILPSSLPTDEVTIVDVGGGFGDDLERFRREFEGRHGRLVLQDLPHVLGMHKTKPPVETMAYDFFTPQPIIGARVYCFRSVLHDWPLEKAISILRNQIPAMKAGQSKIFIYERIIPDMNPLVYTLLFDMIMMTLGSALERTDAQWRELIDQAGLKIVHIWVMPVRSEVMFECEIA